MAMVQPNLHRLESFARQSIQLPVPQDAELDLGALADELGSSLGDIMEAMVELMKRDNFQELKAAIIQKREDALITLQSSLDEAYNYLGSLPETLEDARFLFDAGLEGIVA